MSWYVRVLITMLSLVGAGVMVTATPAQADTGGYPYAGYSGPGTNPSGSYWADSGGNGVSPYGYYYRNCTDYVAWKLQSLGVPDSKTRGLGNGGQWATNASGRPGVTVSTTPAAGSAAIKVSTASDPYGHVAFVESVNTNGTITVAEYNWVVGGTPDGAFHRRTATAASMGLSIFVNFGASYGDSGTPPAPVNGHVYYINNGWDAQHDFTTSYGNDGTQTLVGDWNGNGVDTLAMRVGNTFYMNDDFDGQHSMVTTYGNPGADIYVGDWDGDGVDTLAMRVGNVFYVNNAWDMQHDFTVAFGNPGAEIVVGDWNGDGIDTFGMRSGNTFYMNNNFDGSHDFVTSYGDPGQKVVVGDWNGNGVDTLGVRVGNTFYMNDDWDGQHNLVTSYGNPENQIFVGDWNGDNVPTLAMRNIV